MARLFALAVSFVSMLVVGTAAAEQDQARMLMVRQLFEKVWNENDMKAANVIIHKDYSSSENITFSSLRGLQVVQADMKFYREKYSNLKFSVERMFTHGDSVVSFWRASGVANHAHFVARNGEKRKKELKADGMSLSRIADGKIIEHKLYWPRYPLFP